MGMGIAARGRQVPDEPGLFEIVLNNTGSGWLEKFLLFVPTVPIEQRSPLLVVFHRFGVSHWDAYYNTTFFQEARARRWFVIAPLGASQKSFSSLEAQINVQAALGYVTSHFNIDPSRVYGVGFSMGGGAVTSYAARHVDPSGVMFAAVLNDTGGVSLSNTWALEYDDDDVDDNHPNPGDHLEVPDILEFWFGGPPATRPFYYQRCSMIDLDPNNGTIGVGTDMSRNLSHVPVRDWMANNDPIQYLRDQTTSFDTHVNSQNLNNTLTVVNGTVHNWSTLDDHAVCDWLSQFSLQIPLSANTLADQDGTYFWFNVTQTAAGSFTPFSWALDTANNRISIFNTANLARLTLDATDAGLQYSGSLKINVRARARRARDDQPCVRRLQPWGRPAPRPLRDAPELLAGWGPSTASHTSDREWYARTEEARRASSRCPPARDLGTRGSSTPGADLPQSPGRRPGATVSRRRRTRKGPRHVARVSLSDRPASRGSLISIPGASPVSEVKPSVTGLKYLGSSPVFGF